MSPEDYERMVEKLLAGTPARILDLAATSNPAQRAELDAARETLASLALALDPVAPPRALRDRLAASLAAHPKHPPRRALLVLDMLVDHLAPGGALEVARARAIVPAVRTRIDAARRAGEPVIYLCDRHAPDDPELETWGAHDVEGTAGAEVVPELRPEPGDAVIPHRTYSAFHGTDLQRVLEAHRVDTLVLTGCITEMGLLITAADAMMRGFDVQVPPECQAGSSPTAEKVALGTLAVMRPVRAITPGGQGQTTRSPSAR